MANTRVKSFNLATDAVFPNMSSNSGSTLITNGNSVSWLYGSMMFRA